MKRILTLALVLLPLLSMAQDDLYFTSNKKAKQAAQQAAEKARAEQKAKAAEKARISVVLEPTIVDYNSSTRSDDEYNRRYVYGGDYQNAGGYGNDSLTASIDTVPGYYAESDYDLEDPELDYRFSRRIVRFHTPRVYALSSPYYWDLYYGWGAWDYLYDPYDPWYWHYGWSFGWSWGPWDCWYGSIWGWHHPYAWTYWGWGPGWSYPYVGSTHYRYRNVMPREYNSSRNQMAAGNRIRTNAMGRNTLSTRTNALGGRTVSAAGRTNVLAGRTAPQGVRTGATRGGSYTDYSNSRSGRSTMGGSETSRPQVYNRTRENASQRSTVTRQGNTYQPTRSYNNQNSSSRTNSSRSTNTQSNNNSAPTYTPSTRSSSSSSYGGGSVGGGSRGGGSFGGGGGSRGGGGRR